MVFMVKLDLDKWWWAIVRDKEIDYLAKIIHLIRYPELGLRLDSMVFHNVTRLNFFLGNKVIYWDWEG